MLDIEPQPNGATEIVYTPSANPIATSVLQYTDTSNKNTHAAVPVDATTANVLISTEPEPLIDATIDGKGKGHIIYTHGDKTYVETVKDDHIYDNTAKVYATTAGDDAKQPLDLIYEDGGKTVIYTTSSDPKSLELYSGNELNLLEGHQVIVQGQNVYVVAAPPTLDAAEIAAAQPHQRYVEFFNIINLITLLLSIFKQYS